MTEAKIYLHVPNTLGYGTYFEVPVTELEVGVNGSGILQVVTGKLVKSPEVLKSLVEEGTETHFFVITPDFEYSPDKIRKCLATYSDTPEGTVLVIDLRTN